MGQALPSLSDRETGVGQWPKLGCPPKKRPLGPQPSSAHAGQGAPGDAPHRPPPRPRPWCRSGTWRSPKMTWGGPLAWSPAAQSSWSSCTSLESFTGSWQVWEWSRIRLLLVDIVNICKDKFPNYEEKVKMFCWEHLYSDVKFATSWMAVDTLMNEIKRTSDFHGERKHDNSSCRSLSLLHTGWKELCDSCVDVCGRNSVDCIQPVGWPFPLSRTGREILGMNSKRYSLGPSTLLVRILNMITEQKIIYSLLLYYRLDARLSPLQDYLIRIFFNGGLPWWRSG